MIHSFLEYSFFLLHFFIDTRDSPRIQSILRCTFTMSLQGPDDMEETRRAVESREFWQSKPVKRRAKELLKRFAPGLGAGWQIEEETVASQ